MGIRGRIELGDQCPGPDAPAASGSTDGIPSDHNPAAVLAEVARILRRLGDHPIPGEADPVWVEQSPESQAVCPPTQVCMRIQRALRGCGELESLAER